MATRPCRFCLSLQDDAVFADFDTDPSDQVFLRRISFDGYGCCEASFPKMSLADSRVFVDAMQSGAVDRPGVAAALCRYFEVNADLMWPDALITHRLLAAEAPIKSVETTRGTQP